MLVAFEFVVVREETAIKADRRNTRPGRFASKLQSVVFFCLVYFLDTFIQRQDPHHTEERKSDPSRHRQFFSVGNTRKGNPH